MTRAYGTESAIRVRETAVPRNSVITAVAESVISVVRRGHCFLGG
jgi:hypothetical protein